MKIIILIIIFPLSFAFAQEPSFSETDEIKKVKEFPELGVKVETIANNLSIPWSIDFSPDGRIFFSERIGHLRVIEEGYLSNSILNLDVGGGEGGMLGIALHPSFENNHFIYIYYTYNDFLSTKNKVVRYVESNNVLTDETIILDNIPGASFHDGGRIKFGPDGKLFITTGDAGNPTLSQNLNSLAGKILRINPDGSIPDDNPFSNSPIYSYGHRNPQGIAWNKSGILVATEHGPSGFRGFAHDEINVINPGQNYGWPDIIGDERKEELKNPILHSGEDTWAPSGATFYYGQKIPEWDGMFFAAALRGQHLHIIEFDWSEEKVKSHGKLFLGEFGRLRDVVMGPDGFLYMLTSNTDGRGDPSDNDDKILRIKPIIEINNFEKCIAAGYPAMESYPRQCITSDGKHFVEEVHNKPKKIPEWVRNIFLWYGQNQISEDEVLNAIKFLLEQGIIRLERDF